MEETRTFLPLRLLSVPLATDLALGLIPVAGVAQAALGWDEVDDDTDLAYYKAKSV